MTRGEEHNIERAVGRIEAQLEALADAVKPLSEMRSDIVDLKRRADLWSVITEKFNALEDSIHDGKLAAKSGTKGFILGVTFAGGAVGATAATGVKWVVSAIWGAP
jgi:hypothetical protein